MTTEQPQHMVALDRANQVRLRRAALRRDVFAGRMTLIEAAQHPDNATLPLFRLAQWQRRWGVLRATKLVKEVGATEYTTCGKLTPRQLQVLHNYNHNEKRS